MFFLRIFSERVVSVSSSRRDGGLQNNRAGIEVFIDEMDGAAGELYAVFERLALGFKAGEGGRAKDEYSDAVWIFGDEEGRLQAHVSS